MLVAFYTDLFYVKLFIWCLFFYFTGERSSQCEHSVRRGGSRRAHRLRLHPGRLVSQGHQASLFSYGFYFFGVSTLIIAVSLFLFCILLFRRLSRLQHQFRERAVQADGGVPGGAGRPAVRGVPAVPGPLPAGLPGSAEARRRDHFHHTGRRVEMIGRCVVFLVILLRAKDGLL